MNALEEKLRAALRETADEISPQAPPLRLHPRPGRRRFVWAAPIASAALVVVLIAASIALAGGIRHQQASAAKATSAPAGPAGVPAYYVALTTKKPDSDIYSLGATAAEVRSTATGAVLAKVTPPRPYVSFTGVTGAADDRTFVLSAQGPNDPGNLSSLQYNHKYPDGYYPAQRFFLLRIEPGAKAGRRMSLTALPAAYTPANDAIHDMALSPDGTTLAADVGGVLFNDKIYVFNLATGTERAWSVRTCAKCLPTGGGLVYQGVNVDALSWTADGHHLTFIWNNTVRLLDIADPGTNLLADSKAVAIWTVSGSRSMLPMWRGAIITPDGRAVLAVEAFSETTTTAVEHLVRFSTATRRQTAILNNLNAPQLNFEQILYANATGSVLVVTFLRPGRNATILHDGHDTPIPWSPYIGVAAW